MYSDNTEEEFEINLNTVHTYLNELIDQGRIIREKRGVYKLNENRVSFTFTRSGGDLEDDGYIFEYIVEPQIAGLSDTIQQIWYYAVSEMINIFGYCSGAGKRKAYHR